MRNQFERMIAGELYIAHDPILGEKFTKCQTLLFEYNQTRFDQQERRAEICKELFDSVGDNVTIIPPLRSDYGSNIKIGNNFFANYDCILLDVAPIEIGNNVMFGPRVGVYTAGHPLDAEVRDTGLEFGTPVKIGNSVWIGANAVINPGVTIGNNVVIGSGSVVSKDIPDNVIAVGNPCRVLREISVEDKKVWKELQENYEKEYGISL